MLHAKNFCSHKAYRRDCIDWDDYTHTPYADHSEMEGRTAQDIDKNLIVQLAGDDPDILVNAGQIVQAYDNVCGIDLNLGCPQKIAKRGNYGAYLLQDTDKVVSLLAHLVDKLDKPITAKIRRLASAQETIRLVQRIESVGVSMVAIHGRQVEQSKLFTGACDWDIIRDVKDAVSIPVFANGGIQYRQDALNCLEYTKCDGVMSSEGLLENPKLFNENGDAAFRENYIKAQFDTIDEYLKIMLSYKAPRPFYQVVRSHMFKFLYRFLDGPQNYDLRARMGKGLLTDIHEVVSLLKKRLATVDYDEHKALAVGLLGPTLWYLRHRDERAKRRIMSIPKRLAADINTEELSVEEIRARNQRDLKERLLTRKQVEPTGSYRNFLQGSNL